jgi:hypothetical protein
MPYNGMSRQVSRSQAVPNFVDSGDADFFAKQLQLLRERLRVDANAGEPVHWVLLSPAQSRARLQFQIVSHLSHVAPQGAVRHLPSDPHMIIGIAVGLGSMTCFRVIDPLRRPSDNT